MKKFYFWSILILFILALLPAGLWAQNDTQRSASDSQREPNTHVTATHAMDVGYAFMRTGNGSRSGGTQSGNVRKQAMQLVYTGRATDTLTRATTDCYYVFALQPKGFVIVAADNRVEPILGYSYDNNFVVENMPEHIKGWLNDYEKQIEVVTKSARPAEASIQTKWNSLESGQPISNTRNGNTVGPLLTTTWSQSPYYNAFCPEIGNSHAPTGCVATAMAQIINYWQYPLHGRGTHSYNSNYGTLTVNYDSAYYDYDIMPDALTSSSTPEQVNAVATLMYHCGVATNMQYNLGESGAFEVDARAALIDFFRFSPNCSFAEKSNFSNPAWHTMLYENLDANIPVLYSGVGNSGGHSFVCDGYDNNHFFHFNFGWNGNNDGWYLTTAINPGSQSYNSSQTALVGLVPDSISNIIIGQMQGASTFFVGESVEFYHLLGHNAYTGTNYSNNCNNTVTLFPSDTTKQLVLDVISFENQNVSVYDSISGNQLASLSSTTSNNSIVSTAHALTLLYQGSMHYSGFQLNISQDNGCRMVSNVTWSVDTNTIHLSWHESGNASQWQIEYGLKGFSHGNGAMVITNDTTIDIDGLASFKEYDMYIRSVCGQEQNGPWRMVTVMPEAKYWTDVVTSQPEGYVEDTLGNVYISTAEGLAWFSRLSQEKAYDSDPWFFRGHKAVLTADINIGQYKWKKIYNFCGVFDGQGHKIDSMYAFEHGNMDASLFGTVAAVIKNTYLTNCYTRAYGEAGGIASSVDQGTIMNCYVSGRMEIQSNVAGVVAPISCYAGTGSLIINCVSNCQILGGAGHVGGIVGGAAFRGGIIRNCYSASKIQRQGSFNGYVLGYGEEVTVENCYGYISRNGSTSIANGPFSTFKDNTWFDETDSGFYLVQPVFFETDSQNHRGLIDVLNEGVKKYNIDGLRIWVEDTAGINEGMPILGPEYAVTCLNIQNLAARNVVNENGEFGVELSWTERGNATTWEIEYRVADSLNKTRVMTNSRPDTLWGLTEHATYVFRVRPICGVADYGGWSDEIKHVFDRLYWTEVVTSQPEGYSMDAEGNVTISSSEGLAWLASVVNGLNGQTANDFYEKTVTLTQDINIGRYKWTAINEFWGTFNGQGHTISNLYINELANYQGLFGLVYGGKYLNIILDSAYVKGDVCVGILIGKAENTLGPANHLEILNKIIQLATIVNCHVSGIVYGENYVGGLAGGVVGEDINMCSSSGIVHANQDEAGGLFSNVVLARYDGYNGYRRSEKSIRNCYSRCDVTAQRYTAGGLIGTTQHKIENSYAIGTVSSYRYAGGLSSKSGGGETRNCYATGEVQGAATICFGICEYSKGSLLGGGANSIISNCYGMVGQHPLIGTSADGDPLSVTDTASFTVVNDSVVLLHSVAVGQTYYDNLLDALNAWVDTYDTTGIFLHWVADTSGVNGGFPIFEDIRYNTITLSVADSTPYGTVSGAGIFTNYESTIITAIPDYGSHFVQWNDGNTDNPRTIKLTQDTAFTAIFEKDMYSIIGTSGAEISYSFDFENPARDYMWTLQNGDYVNRWCITTLDDTNRALFISNSNGAYNNYFISDNSKNIAYTTLLLAAGQYNYSYDWRCSSTGTAMTVMLFPVSAQTTSSEWPEFVAQIVHNIRPLPDGATLLGRYVHVEEWTNENGQVNIPSNGEYLICVFWENGNCCGGVFQAPAIDNVQFNKISGEEISRGYIIGSDTVQYLDTVVLTAISYKGYRFVSWHDGNMENPRAIVADTDKYFIATFEYASNVALHVADSSPYGNVIGGGMYSNPNEVPIATISAIPDYGYHFVSWNDGVTDNPRVVSLTQDTAFTAIFEINMYGVVGTVGDSNNYGYVLGSDTVPYLDSVVLTAIPYDGYYFSHWHDGNTENPRTVVADADKYFTATFMCIPSFGSDSIFGYDWYYWKDVAYTTSTEIIDTLVSYTSCDSIVTHYLTIYELMSKYVMLNVADSTPYGTVDGEGFHYGYFDITATISATPNYGYEFVSWNDGNTDNPRIITLTQDTSFTAIFGKGTFSVVGTSEISIDYSFDFEDSTLDRQWTLWNRYYSNRWCVATVDDTNRALLISNNNGQSNTFNIESTSRVYAYTTLHLTSGQYNYNFDWRSNGGQNNSNSWHFMRVILIPASDEIDDNEWSDPYTLPSNAVRLHRQSYYLNSNFAWTSTSGTLSINEGIDYKMVIQWYNTYDYYGSNLSATVDNIHFYNNVPVEENNHGYVLGSDTVQYLDSVVLTAVPYEGYQFVQWHDGNTDNPRTVVADADKVLRAMFERAFVISDSIVACDSYQWHGNVYTASTMLFDTLPATGGGDSVVAHYLMVNHPAHTAITETACESYVWTHADGSTQTCMVSGNYTYSHIDANGCTQVDTLHLTIYHAANLTSSVSACDSYIWTHADGTTQTYTESGDYTYSHEDTHGCTQVDTLHLTINHSTIGEITISTCDSFDWYDSTYTESGDYVLTLSNMTGCDSVVTLHLTVNHPAHTAITETACESYVWTHADGTTQTYFASGDYLYNHSDVNGCVQVDTLHLAIHYPSTSVDEQIACGPFTWINGETYTSSVFGPTYTLTNEAGCDSVVTLSLTMYQSDTTQFSITACNNFVWGDNTYTETGDYAQTSEGLNGCLSVTIMHLTINYSDTTEESATACDNYFWHGNNYAESGDYTAYYTNAVGCNSMTTLHLTVNHSSGSEITAAACENYEWHGIVYTESGDYEHTLTAANGCDSVVTLHLTVNEDVATEFTITTADTCYIWNGQSYCASGDYTQNFETVDGCDSVVTLHLTITVGIDDYDFANVMKLYPNPTSDLVNVQLTINNEQLNGIDIQLFDVYGRLLEVVNMADARGASLQTTRIDLSRYAQGVYFVKAVSEGKVIAVRKVVKR